MHTDEYKWLTNNIQICGIFFQMSLDFEDFFFCYLHCKIRSLNGVTLIQAHISLLNFSLCFCTKRPVSNPRFQESILYNWFTPCSYDCLCALWLWLPPIAPWKPPVVTIAYALPAHCSHGSILWLPNSPGSHDCITHLFCKNSSNSHLGVTLWRKGELTPTTWFPCCLTELSALHFLGRGSGWMQQHSQKFLVYGNYLANVHIKHTNFTLLLLNS